MNAAEFRVNKIIDKKNINGFKKVGCDIQGWIIMIPSLVLFAFYIWKPLLYGIYLSFFKTKGFNPESFAGLNNYIEIIREPVFLQALKNTFSYTLWSIVIGFFIPIILAVIINEMVHLQSFFRVSIYFPNIVPGVAALLMWSFILEPGAGGLFNAIRAQLGMSPIGWLQDTRFTIPLIIMAATWKGAGATAMIYIANLQGINQDLYEAAALDGAGIWGKLRYITIPHLFNLCRLTLILQVIFVFQILYEPMVMTSGGPNNASMSLMLMNFNYAFREMQAGKAASIGVIVSMILISLTAAYLSVNKEKETA